jgi:hypothetical protein
MSATSPVEFADQLSRKRPICTAFALLVFLGLQPFVHPGFGATGPVARGYGWALNAAVLLALLLPITGFVRGRRVRELVHDEVSRLHARSAMAAGFWIAMASALGLYVLPVSDALSARDALYLVVTPALTGALLLFCWLEWRALRDE